jgi:hypothetical protein
LSTAVRWNDLLQLKPYDNGLAVGLIPSAKIWGIVPTHYYKSRPPPEPSLKVDVTHAHDKTSRTAPEVKSPIFQVLPKTSDNQLEDVVASLEHRVGPERIEPNYGVWDEAASSYLAIIAPFMPKVVHPMNFDKWLRRYDSQKAVRLQKAHEWSFTLSSQDLIHRCFIKTEVVPPKLSEPDQGVKPRMVQAPTELARTILGPWMVAFSHKYQKATRSTSLLYTSGCTAEKLGEYYDQWLEQLGDVVAYNSDFSTYDATLGLDALAVENAMYDYFGLPADAHRVLASQVSSPCVTALGVKWRMLGGRKSGDPNTSVGNSLLNAIVHTRMFELLKIPLTDYRGFIMGDDFMALIKRQYEQVLNNFDFKKFYTSFGLKSEQVIGKNAMYARFCSGRFWPVETVKHGAVGLGHVLGPMIGRTLVKLGFSYAKTDDATWRYGLSQSLKSGYHVPFVREYLLYCERTGRPGADPPRFRQVEGLSRHEYVPETWSMLQEIYGAGPVAVQQFEELLLTAGNLGQIDWDLLPGFLAVDQ